MSDILATDLIQALYVDAGMEEDAERAAQLKRDADMLHDIWQRSKYALAPSRDQMQRAIGNVSLNLGDTLLELAREMRGVREVVSNMHTHVQNNDILVSNFIESFTPFEVDARAAWEDSGKEIKKLTQQYGEVIERLDRKRQELDDHELRLQEVERRLGIRHSDA